MTGSVLDPGADAASQLPAPDTQSPCNSLQLRLSPEGGVRDRVHRVRWADCRSGQRRSVL